MINFRNSYKLLQWLSVLSAVIVIVVLRFHISSTSVKILIGEKEASQFRVMIPTALFITFGFFSFLSQYKFYKKIYLILLSIICLGAIIVQMHRSVLITLILVFFYAIYSLYKFSFRNMYKWIIFLFLFFAIFYFVFNFISISPSQILQNISTSKEEISNNSGDFGIRTFLIIHALHYVIDNYFVFGVGLHWAYISDLNAYIINKFVAGPTYDSGYNNIIIVFGIWGIFIYLYLFISLFKSLFFCIKSAKTYELKSYSYTLLFISIYTFISGYTSDNFLILQAQVTVFILTLALTYSLENNIKQFYDASNSTKTRGRLG